MLPESETTHTKCLCDNSLDGEKRGTFVDPEWEEIIEIMGRKKKKEIEALGGILVKSEEQLLIHVMMR